MIVQLRAETLAGKLAPQYSPINDVQQSTFELRLADLRQLTKAGHNLSGSLLSACSAHDANAKSQQAVIRHLVKSGVSIHETDKNGVTPLHRAVTNTGAPATPGKGDTAVEIARVLLAHGADPRLKKNRQDTNRLFAKRCYEWSIRPVTRRSTALPANDKLQRPND